MSLPKIHTDLLWLLTIVFCGLGFVYFIFAFFFRNKLSRRSSMVADKKRELAPIISHFLFHEKDSPIDERKEYLSQKVEVREMIKTSFNRSVLAEILMDLQKDVSGEARRNLYDLYVGLGLHQDAYAKLNSWRWEVVSQGILELTQMRVEESYLFIRRFINHSRGVIRKQAQIATVSLKNEGISYFLDSCRYRISEWQQLKLIDVLRHLEDFTPPRFKIWLTSKNKDVVLFSLRLIRYYNQNDANHAIIQLIKHRNVDIRSEAIQCLKEFGVTESLDTLKTSFRRSSAGVKLSILDAIGALGSKKDIEFLKKVERTEENFTIKSKALTAINIIDPDSIMPREDIREPSRSDIEFAGVDEESAFDTKQTKLQFDSMKPKEEPQEEVNMPKEELNGPEGELNLPEEELSLPEEELNLLEEEVNLAEEEVNLPEEDLNLPELEEENQSIFDLCFKEELKEILDEAWQEEEPEYLELSFLPVVGNSDKESAEKTDAISNSQPLAEHPISEDEKFRQDLDNILNKIAMKNDQDQSKNNESIPEFIPKVVDETAQTEESPDSDEFLMEMEEISELIYGKTDLFEAEAQPEIVPENREANLLLDTEVFAEIISSDVEELDEQDKLEETDSQDEVNDEEEELNGFSIFHEMFRDFDSESKLIMLDEILVVGEEKELRFLGTLSKDPDGRIRKKAAKIKALLAEKLKNIESASDPVTTDLHKDSSLIERQCDQKEEMVLADEQGQPTEVMSVKQKTKKLPLEFCFYQGDDAIESENFEPHFEVDTEIDEETEIQSTDYSEDQDQNDEKTGSFLENLLSLSSKSKQKKNG